jgi:ribosomal protein L37E
MLSQYNASLVALLRSRKCGSHAFTGQGCYLHCYVLGNVVEMHSQDKAMLVALLCSRNCGRNAFKVQGYVSCFVMF